MKNSRTITLSFILLISCFALDAMAQVNDYYVAPTGNDSNDGSRARPWATITHADSALTLGPKGATVHVLPGTYNGNIKTFTSGAPARTLVIESDSPGRAVIHGASGNNTIWEAHGSYVTIQGFDISANTGSIRYGITVFNASHVLLTGNTVHDMVGSGCDDHGGSGLGSGDSTVDIIGNTIYNIDPSSGGGRWCHGIYLGGVNGSLAGTHIYNNLIYNNPSGWGIDVAQNVSVGGWTNISNNTIVNNGTASGSCSISGGSCGGGLTIDARGGSGNPSNLTINNNIVLNNPGSGRTFGGSSPITNSQLHNNILFGNRDNTYSNIGSGTSAPPPLNVNPRLVSATDYHLTPNSPAVGAGTNTFCAAGRSPCTPITDMEGNLRSTPVSIGVYELGSAANSVRPPTGLTATVQ